MKFFGDRSLKDIKKKRTKLELCLFLCNFITTSVSIPFYFVCLAEISEESEWKGIKISGKHRICGSDISCDDIGS